MVKLQVRPVMCDGDSEGDGLDMSREFRAGDLNFTKKGCGFRGVKFVVFNHTVGLT